MQLGELVVVTTTFYRSPEEIRYKLAYRLFEEARRYNLQVLAVDASPDPAIGNSFAELGVHVIPETDKGMGPSRRQGFRAAFGAGAKVVAWVEPEKVDLVRHLRTMMESVLNGAWNLILPRRRAFVNYPATQVHCETVANRMAEIYTGNWYDRWFGPRIFDLEAGMYFLDHPGHKYGDNWESIILPIDAVVTAGLEVAEHMVDYAHPIEQLEAEEGRPDYDGKRWQQLIQILANLERQALDLGFSPLWRPSDRG